MFKHLQNVIKIRKQFIIFVIEPFIEFHKIEFKIKFEKC